MALTGTQLYLAIDVGTSTLKGALITRAGHTVHHEVRRMERRDTARSGGRLAQLVTDVEALVERLGAAALSAGREIAVLGLATHMASALVLDENYEPVEDLMVGVDEAPAWAVEKAALSAKRVGVDLHQQTGCPLVPHYPLPKLYALARCSAETRRVRHVGDLKSYLLWRWAGQFITDFGSASASQLLDQRRREWLDLPGLPWRVSAYPRLCNPWQMVGPIRPTIGAAMGFRQPVSLVVGTGDGIAASIGAGVLHSLEALLTVGTTATVRWRDNDWKALCPGDFRQMVSPRLRLRGSRIILPLQDGAARRSEDEARAAEELATRVRRAPARSALSALQIAGGGVGPVWTEVLRTLGFVVRHAVCEDATFGMAVVMEKALSQVGLGKALQVMRAGRSTGGA